MWDAVSIADETRRGLDVFSSLSLQKVSLFKKLYM